MARGNWEQCVPGMPRGRWQSPQATIRANGDILLTRVTWDILEQPAHAIVLFDRRNQTIGIKPLRGAIRNTHPIEPHGLYGGRIIRAASLPRLFASKLTATMRFHAPEIDADGILNLDLTTATRAQRARSPQGIRPIA